MRPFPTAVALAVLLTVAGCAPPAADPGVANRTEPADVPFLAAMVAHHDRTRVLAAEAAGRIVDPELRTLVAAIDATEADEVATMRRWLADAPADTAPHHGHHGTSTAAAPDPDLARLRSAAVGRFDAVLVDVLTAHQRRAAALARAHLPVAAGPEVRALADRVERSRTAQLKLLSGLPATRPPPGPKR
ncbi:DUF305 domain-containing protein [Micromonospora sp. DT233]|uniref:DUF305 domain-containing protein n=1 Tax=Micromonospora sp. DT233 TaxID=3393432 RepID=UPI003CF340C5